jgi:hypothetical protein
MEQRHQHGAPLRSEILAIEFEQIEGIEESPVVALPADDGGDPLAFELEWRGLAADTHHHDGIGSSRRPLTNASGLLADQTISNLWLMPSER